jgi:hypothetical protein
MKKITMIMLAMAFFWVSNINAQENRIVVFDNNPDGFIKYVNFSFMAPWINCESGATYRWKAGQWGAPGSWEFHNQGEQLPPGWYFFKNPCEGMSIVLQGEMTDLNAQSSTWSAHEIEPADVGLFVRGWQEGSANPGLPTSDEDWDYHLLAPTWGVQSSLSTYLSDYFIYMSGKLVAVIISQERGFLQRMIFVGSRQFNDLMVDADDVIILIYYNGSKRIGLARQELRLGQMTINQSQ